MPTNPQNQDQDNRNKSSFGSATAGNQTRDPSNEGKSWNKDSEENIKKAGSQNPGGASSYSSSGDKRNSPDNKTSEGGNR